MFSQKSQKAIRMVFAVVAALLMIVLIATLIPGIGIY